MDQIETKFEMYRENLRQESGKLADFIDVYRRLRERKKDFLEEINVAPCFFILVEESFFAAIVLWTDKLFDEKSERGFFNFLKLVEHNREIVSVAELQRRRSYPDDHWMLENRHDISFKDIKADRDRIRGLSCLSNIRKWRDQYHAHFDKKYFFDRPKLNQDALVLWSDLEEVLEVAGDLINKYSTAYDGKFYELTAVNTKDLDSLLRRVRRGKHEPGS